MGRAHRRERRHARPDGSLFSPANPIRVAVNKRGNPQSLVPAHPGNLNALKQGVHSPRLIHARAAEIAVELTKAFAFSPTELLAVNEAARCIAVLEAIDRDLDERGVADKDGEPRYLLNHRARASRQLEQWLTKVSAAVERLAKPEQVPPRGDFIDFVQALQAIAFGQDASASARDRLSALRELLELGHRGRTSYLERPSALALEERWQRVYEEKRRRDVEREETKLGLDEDELE